MSKALILILLATEMLFACQSKIKSDVSIAGWKGPVKKIIETEYFAYPPKGWSGTENIHGVQIVAFNQDGFTTELSVMKQGGKSLIFKIIYEYDTDGHKRDSKVYANSEKPVGICTSAYNTRQLLSELCIHEKNREGKEFFKVNFEYDKNGRITSESQYLANNHKAFKYIPQYASDNQVSVLSCFELNTGKLDHRYTYKYVKHDSYGNWLQNSTYQNDSLLYISDRQIEYW